MPTQLAYCPSLSVAAFDCILKGFSQPMLGSFSIDLPAFIQKSRDTMEIKFTKASQILSNYYLFSDLILFFIFLFMIFIIFSFEKACKGKRMKELKMKLI